MKKIFSVGLNLEKKISHKKNEKSRAIVYFT